MTGGIIKNLRHVGMISVIIGLMMANFFHAFLMNAAPSLSAAESYGACHAHEKAGGEKKEDGAQKDILPCCADKKGSTAAPLLAIYEFNKSFLIPSSRLGESLPISHGLPKPKSFQAPPSQIALDTIVLRI